MMAQGLPMRSHCLLELAQEATPAQIRRTQLAQLQALKLSRCLAAARGSAVPARPVGILGLPPSSQQHSVKRELSSDPNTDSRSADIRHNLPQQAQTRDFQAVLDSRQKSLRAVLSYMAQPLEAKTALRSITLLQEAALCLQEVRRSQLGVCLPRCAFNVRCGRLRRINGQSSCTYRQVAVVSSKMAVPRGQHATI